MSFEDFKGLMIYSADFRELGFCSDGVRKGFAKYSLSYSDFVYNGIDAQALLEACEGNAMVMKVVENAKTKRSLS